MEHQFTFRVPNDCSTNGAANNATAPSCPSGCAEPAQTFGASNSPIRGLGTSAGGNMASLATSMATSVGSKRKRACSEMPEEERPGKKHFVPSREVTLKDHNGLPVKVQFDSYNDPDDELELPAGGIPEDVDADITDLVPRDPQASYNHPWADIPGIVDSVLEEGSKEK
ncbi:hypothetical protein F5Y05DRAFT_387192 [Hypoxylon sp. FL0543]|nr:hypothetical protein F5Y05DRAFT_387192 [Hypoxylon sp. FL0543]